MDAYKYLHSQKGKVIEKMKIAYLSGKHIFVVEKIEDILLKEILQDSSVIPLRKGEKKNGFSYESDNLPSVIMSETDNFIKDKLECLPTTAAMYVFKCKDTNKSVSPQLASTSSSLPEISLNTYIGHISGLSTLTSHSNFPSQHKALLDSAIIIATNTSLDIPAKYAAYIEYIKVPTIEYEEFKEVVSAIISSIDHIKTITDKKGYAVIDNAESYLQQLYYKMKGLNVTHIKSILYKLKNEKGYAYSDNEDFQNILLSFVHEEVNRIISLSCSLSIINSKDEEPAALENISRWIGRNEKKLTSDYSRYAFMEMKAPKGILVSGIPGTGKSMMAKYIGEKMNLPLVRFDFGNLFGGLVGDSEKNMRESLSTIDALAPCVVWVDEMEKAFNSGRNANETTTRLIGMFLTWMQDKKSRSFIFATANDISHLPPEMFRSGRFDEKFYTFLPSAEDCGKIFEGLIIHQNDDHKKKTSSNLEARSLFDKDINRKMFVDLLNAEDNNICILDKQSFDEKRISRKNKLFIGSDIAKIVEDAKSFYIEDYGFPTFFEAEKFRSCLKLAISEFKTYGETNLKDIATCYSKLANANFTSASDSILMPFDGYNEIECFNGGDLYSCTEYPKGVYNTQIVISVRNALNGLGKRLLDNNK